MEDIELIIKMPEEMWEQVKEGYIPLPLDISKYLKNSTPLPKGHGGLIDVGQCDKKLFYRQCGGADSLITVKSAFDMLMSLPTIIEADKE